MKEAFEKIKERLEEESQYSCSHCMERAIKIVSEVEAEYGNGCEKHTYEIRLNGCDDDTNFEMELTEREYKFLLRVSELANKTSTYGCMPRLYVREYTTTTD